MTSAGQDVNKHQTEYIPFSKFLAILIRFLKAKAKTLVNSTTKYHEAKVTTTKKKKKNKKTKKKQKKRYMYILFQKYPKWENRANVRPIRPAT